MCLFILSLLFNFTLVLDPIDFSLFPFCQCDIPVCPLYISWLMFCQWDIPVCAAKNSLSYRCTQNQLCSLKSSFLKRAQKMLIFICLFVRLSVWFKLVSTFFMGSDFQGALHQNSKHALWDSWSLHLILENAKTRTIL